MVPITQIGKGPFVVMLKVLEKADVERSVLRQIGRIPNSENSEGILLRQMARVLLLPIRKGLENGDQEITVFRQFRRVSKARIRKDPYQGNPEGAFFR